MLCCDSHSVVKTLEHCGWVGVGGGVFYLTLTSTKESVIYVSVIIVFFHCIIIF